MRIAAIFAFACMAAASSVAEKVDAAALGKIAEKRLGEFSQEQPAALINATAPAGANGKPKYQAGTVVPLVPFKDEIPQVAREFYRTLDKEYISSAKRVIAEIDCCHPDAAGGKNGIAIELKCPHEYPNVPFEYTNQTTGKTVRNPSDCACQMSAARSKARFETSSAALVAFYRQMSFSLDQEGSFQAGMAKALKNFAKQSKGALLETKVLGKKVSMPDGLLEEKSFLIETDWDKIGVNATSLLELSQKHLVKYIPSEQPGVEFLKDLRAMEKTYKATRDLHLRAYKRVILANRPFMASVEAYVQVVKRYNGEIRRMLEAHTTLSLKGEPLVRSSWSAENPDYDLPPKGYEDFLLYLFERYDIEESADPDSMEDTREAEFDAAGLPQSAFHTQNVNNQDKDGEYESMEADFSKVYKMMRNKFLRCAIGLREVIPAIEATWSALKPLDYGAPLMNEYQFLGTGWCLKERGVPTYDDTEDARERGYTGPIDKYYIKNTFVYNLEKREECEEKCSNAHLAILAANKPMADKNVEDGDVDTETFNIEGIDTFHVVVNRVGAADQVQKECAAFCEENKDEGCTSAHIPKVHADTPEGVPILKKGEANIYDEYFLDSANMEDCKSYCYGSYRQQKGAHKGKILTQHGCYCQESWSTRYDTGAGGEQGAQIYNPTGSDEMGNEGIMMCSEMGNHAEGREWCKVEPNCEAFKGNEGSEGGKLRRLHSDMSDGAKYGTNDDAFIWNINEYSGQWDYCVKFSEPAFEDAYGNNLCLMGDDWGSFHIPGGGSPGGEDGEMPPEAEWQAWHGERQTAADSWEDCQDVCDKIGTYDAGDKLWVHPRLRCGNFYYEEEAPEEAKCTIELAGPNCKINLWNCQSFLSGCEGYEYNSEYSLCRIFPPDDGKYHKDPNLPGYGRPGSSEGINEVITWDGLDCMSKPQTFVPRGLAQEVEDYKDPWVKTLWYPETCPFDEQAREDYARMMMDEEVGGGPSCMKCKYEIALGPQTDNYYDPYVKEYKDVIESELRRYEKGENPYFVHPYAEFEREFFKWECWRRESITYKKDLWYDKLETGYHVWEWPGHSKHDAQEVDEVQEAQDDELWNEIQEYKYDIIEHNENINKKVDKYENCVQVVSPELKAYSIKPHIAALDKGVQTGRVRTAGLRDFDQYYENLCEHSGAGEFDCDGISICDLAKEIEVEYGLRNELQHVLDAAQLQLAAGSQARYVDHEEAWIKPKLREARKNLDCIEKSLTEYESSSRSYMAFLKSESEIAAFSKDRWYNRLKDLIEKWNGASTGFIERSANTEAPSGMHARYGAIHAELDAQWNSMQEVNATVSKSKVGTDPMAALPLMETSAEAREATLNQMTRRVDENAFRLVDFAAVYIESREAHVRAINDLVLSMGPYLTALKAYSVALKSYADAAEEKATHILNMRDLARIEKTVNDARAIVAFNDLKGGASGAKPHPWFSDDDRKGQGYYAAAYFKQREQEKYMMDAWREDIETGHYQTLGNKLKSGKTDLFYAFAPYFIPFPPEHWMMKLALENDDDIMVDLVERDYETNKAKYMECTATVQKHTQAFRKALNAAQVMPAGL